MHPVGTLASNRRGTRDTATPLPVMMAAAPCNLGDGCSNHEPFSEVPGSSSDSATVTLTVSPAASASPTWTESGTTTLATTDTPAPTATGSLVLASTKASGADSVSGSATIGGQTVTQTSPVYVYPSIAFGCNTGTYTQLQSALAFSGGVETSLSSPTGADLYVDGPYCTGAFQNLAEAGTTLHAPYGAAHLSNYDGLAFIDIPTSSWSSAFTAEPIETTIDGSNATEYTILKTASGTYVKFEYLQGYGDDSAASPSTMEFAWEQSGSSIDGKF